MVNARVRRSSVYAVALAVALACSAGTASFAQDNMKVEGLIKGRSGATMILQTTENPKLVVQLTDTTDVAQVQGMLKARSKEMSMAALIPGLPVTVEGFMNLQKELVATKVRFKGNDLQHAQEIQAGLHETKAMAEQNEAELAKQKEDLEKQQAELEKQQAQMTEQEKKVAANKAAIAQNSARFGQLDDYFIFDQATVLFGNGVTKLNPQYQPQLKALAEKAKGVDGYMIEVKGYASATGSVELNQELSEKRANSVVSYLIQNCHIPLTNMLAPGAMGESRQVASGNKAEAQAENRRVVVRLLQNKAIAGTQ